MIQVPNEIKWLFQQDSISKNFRVSFPNSEYPDLINKDIVSESVLFTESVGSTTGLKFGLCEGATLEFDMFFNQNIRNMKIYAQIEIDISSLDAEFISEYGVQSRDVPYPYYPIPYGYFYVDSCKRDGQNNRRRVVAYQNKYDLTEAESSSKAVSDDTSSQLVKLTTFDKLRFNSEASKSEESGTVVPNTFEFNPILSYCSSLANADIAVKLIDAFDALGASVSIDDDITLYESGTERFNRITFSDISDKRETARKSYYVGNDIYIDVYGLGLNFTGINHIDNCRGQLRGSRGIYHTDEDSYNYIAYPKVNEVFEFDWEVDTDLSPQKVANDVAYYVNKKLDELHVGTRRVKESTVYNYIRPQFNCLGSCTEYSEADMTVPPGLNRYSPITYYFDERTFCDRRVTLTPFNRGITNYQGINNAYQPSHLGCVGYAVFIPMRINVYYAVEDRSLYTDNMIKNNIRVTSYRFSNLALTTQYSRKQRTLKRNGYSNVTGYDAAEIIVDVEKLNSELQKTFDSVIEASGTFLKFDREVDGGVKLINPTALLGLYPSPDIYPLSRTPQTDALYPKSTQHIISRALWRNLWYDDSLSKVYKRVIASWQQNGVTQTIIYNIIPEEEQGFYPDAQDYNISNNVLVTTFGLAQNVVEHLGEILKYVKYYPTDLEMRALPYMEAGDSISVITQDSGFETLCLRHRISGVHALMDNIEAR